MKNQNSLQYFFGLWTVPSMVYLNGHCPMDYKEFMEYAVPPYTPTKWGTELVFDAVVWNILHNIKQLANHYCHWTSILLRLSCDSKSVDKTWNYKPLSIELCSLGNLSTQQFSWTRIEFAWKVLFLLHSLEKKRVIASNWILLTNFRQIRIIVARGYAKKRVWERILKKFADSITRTSVKSEILREKRVPQSSKTCRCLPFVPLIAR